MLAGSERLNGVVGQIVLGQREVPLRGLLLDLNDLFFGGLLGEAHHLDYVRRDHHGASVAALILTCGKGCCGLVLDLEDLRRRRHELTKLLLVEQFLDLGKHVRIRAG